MAWSDDTRCLFCDGKLPLLRKMAQGQFCSQTHQTAYWKEQEQLALQLLHRTHDALRSHPSDDVSAEAILGPSAAGIPEQRYYESTYQGLPELQGFLGVAFGSAVPIASRIVAAEPFEYEARPTAALQLAGALPATLDHAPLGSAGPIEIPAVAQARDIELRASPGTPLCVVPELVLVGGGTVVSAPPTPLERAVSPVQETLFPVLMPTAARPKSTLGDAEPVNFSVVRPCTPQAACLADGGLGWQELGDLIQLAVGVQGHLTLAAECTPVDGAEIFPNRMRLDVLFNDPHPQAAPRLETVETGVGGPWGALQAGGRPPVSYPVFEPGPGPQHPTSTMLLAEAGSPQTFLRTRLFALHKLMDRVVPRNSQKLRPGIVAFPAQGSARLPRLKMTPIKQRPAGWTEIEAILEPESSLKLKDQVVGFWYQAPRDLKMLLFAVPLALALAFAPKLPKVSLKAGSANGPGVVAGVQKVLDTGWSGMQKRMAERAAVGLDENFRQGLDDWMSNSGSTAEWEFDQAGFVQPGRVALYQPSLALKDYELQFLGAIDRGALSWVTRAADFENYYVVKLMVVKDGPVPQLGITRYAVINGKPVDRVDTPVSLTARTDSLFRVSMTVDGNRYALTIQGQVIDAWTETRLKHGGVGFFTNRGEKSRIGWMQVTHQFDMLGRLFAYLAP